ncbi:MAG: Ig-like domain-containing protein [Isosphaeraceae bacterium]
MLTVGRSVDAGTPGFRIFTVLAGADVTIAGLTITGGKLTTAGGADGGGIKNSGSLTVIDSILSSNAAGDSRIPSPQERESSGRGGGVFNSGTLTITGSTISDNTTLSPSQSAAGGGIYNAGGTLTITASTLNSNSANRGSGGGIYNASGTVTVTECSLIANASGLGSGGGISNAGGSMSIADSTLSRNTATSPFPVGGGGIDNAGGTMTITASTINSNQSGYGGGISNRDNGTVTITASTVMDNTVVGGVSGRTRVSGWGGGIANAGTMTITASTLSGNSAGVRSEPGWGGAIFNSGRLTLTASTLSGNWAGFGGGIFARGAGTLTATTSLLANSSGGNLVIEAGVPFVSGGHNLFSDTPAVVLQPTDLIGTDPLLGPLADNGGPTRTHALRLGSPAIDAGAPVAGITTDQRGVPRPKGKAPDIGAFEAIQAPLSLMVPDGVNLVGQSRTITATVADQDGRPLAGIPVTFRLIAGPNVGATGTTDPTGGRSDAGGSIRFTYIGAGGPGTDTLVVTATPPSGAPLTAEAGVVWVVPPTVISLGRLRHGSQGAALVVGFSAPMDAARAGSLSSYHIVLAGRDHQFGTKDDRAIRIRSARYDNASHAVKLRATRCLPRGVAFRLTISGSPPGGLTDASGVFLDGAGTGQPGSDYVAIVNRKSLIDRTGRR